MKCQRCFFPHLAFAVKRTLDFGYNLYQSKVWALVLFKLLLDVDIHTTKHHLVYIHIIT